MKKSALGSDKASLVLPEPKPAVPRSNVPDLPEEEVEEVRTDHLMSCKPASGISGLWSVGVSRNLENLSKSTCYNLPSSGKLLKCRMGVADHVSAQSNPV